MDRILESLTFNLLLSTGSIVSLTDGHPASPSTITWSNFTILNKSYHWDQPKSVTLYLKPIVSCPVFWNISKDSAPSEMWRQSHGLLVSRLNISDISNSPTALFSLASPFLYFVNILPKILNTSLSFLLYPSIFLSC